MSTDGGYMMFQVICIIEETLLKCDCLIIVTWHDLSQLKHVLSYADVNKQFVKLSKTVF